MMPTASIFYKTSICDRLATAGSLEASGTNPLLQGAKRLWLGTTGPGLQVRLFRKRMICDTPAIDVQMQIAAEAYFHLWINGHYVTRGPVFHHTAQLPVACLDLTRWWQSGENVIAVLIFTPGFPTHKVPAGNPGLWATIRVRDKADREYWTVSDSSWAATDQVGWRQHAVRHGWALGPVEVLNAATHPWGWQAKNFDDAAWPFAQAMPCSSTSASTPIKIDTPALRFGWAGAQTLVGTWAVGTQPARLEPDQSCEVLGQWLEQEPWHPLASNTPMKTSWEQPSNTLAVQGLTETQGLAVVLDMGQEQVGNIIFECESDSAGLIEIAWSEVIHNGRPQMVHKGTSYVDRMIAHAGSQRWESLQFTGLRYLVLILRGFVGSVRFSQIGVRTSTSAPRLDASWTSSDPKLNAIWQLCTRTLTLGTQETIIDCPSREQAPYLGDGHLVGRWLGHFSGDHRHWRYMIQLGFQSQADDGLLRDAPLFPMHRSLLDYVLLTVMAVRDYVEITGDRNFGHQMLQGCRRAIGYFDRKLDSKAILKSMQVPGVRHVAWDIPGPSPTTASLDPHLFIDHPGLGGHNIGEPGIERRGRSGALHALYVLALDALGDLEQWDNQPSNAQSRRATAHRVRLSAGAAFWNNQRGVFVDAIDEHGQPFEQISEQTNVLAAMAKLSCPVSQATLIRRVMVPDLAVARCGPYFYSYLLPLMCRLGMHAQALTRVRQKWGHMLDCGATTLWETFAGDNMDTWCHPWSAAPASFLMHHILGLRLDKFDRGTITMQPRYDLLCQASGQIPTPLGPCCLEWTTSGRKIHLAGHLPPGLKASLHACTSKKFFNVTSQWKLELPIPHTIRWPQSQNRRVCLNKKNEAVQPVQVGDEKKTNL